MFVIQKKLNKIYYKGEGDDPYTNPNTNPLGLLRVEAIYTKKFTKNIKEAKTYKTWNEAFEFIFERKSTAYEIISI